MWSFCIAKGFVLVCKRSPFTLQKESFWKAKGPLLKNSSNPTYRIRYKTLPTELV